MDACELAPEARVCAPGIEERKKRQEGYVEIALAICAIEGVEHCVRLTRRGVINGVAEVEASRAAELPGHLFGAFAIAGEPVCSRESPGAKLMPGRHFHEPTETYYCVAGPA